MLFLSVVTRQSIQPDLMNDEKIGSFIYSCPCRDVVNSFSAAVNALFQMGSSVRAEGYTVCLHSCYLRAHQARSRVLAHPGSCWSKRQLLLYFANVLSVDDFERSDEK